jgi:hypothetical protein
MVLPYFSEQPHSEYRDYRQYLLYLYCHGALLRFSHAYEIVGIALEPYDSDIVSVDFLYIHTHGISIDEAYREEIEMRLREEGMWDPAAVSGYFF